MMKQPFALLWRYQLASRFQHPRSFATAGYALPMAFALGLSMLALAATSILLAQDGRDSAALRRDSAASVLVADSAIAEVLAVFDQIENSMLLGLDYDPINPRTGVNYLGADGIPNSGDEGAGAVNQWDVSAADYACQSQLNGTDPSMNLTRIVTPLSGYEILAYRFDEAMMNGHLLVQGTHQGISTTVHVSLSLNDDLTDFPALVASQGLHWQGRMLQGAHSNFYFNPDESADRALNSVASRDSPARTDYLNAIWSGSLDGFAADPIQGKGIACGLSFSLPSTPRGNSLGEIRTSTSLVGSSTGVQEFQVDRITLTGSNELTVDTTDGPVHLYINGPTDLRGNAKIRNVRRDAQAPQVGDLRLIQTDKDGAGSVFLYDSSCIEKAFTYAPEGVFHQLTSSAGCLGGNPSNVQGVVWAKTIENSTNSTTARTYDRQDRPDVSTPGVIAGIEVPESLENLADAIASVNLPRRFEIDGVIAWNTVRL